MAQYINKDALVAEIERLKNTSLEYGYNTMQKVLADSGKDISLRQLQNFIDDIEVKSVDLEEDINDFINEEYHYTEYDGKWIDEKDWRDSIQRCAKHFFELGIKTAQKGE